MAVLASPFRLLDRGRGMSTQDRARTLVAAFAVTSAVSLAAYAGPAPLLDAIRRNDVASVARLLNAGADLRSIDETGTTMLMYAALYAGPEVIDTLVARGADVNATNHAGSTALMYGVWSAANVKTLVARGANVHARAKNGATALVAAARQGRPESMKILLVAGADPKSTDADRLALLDAAYANRNLDVRRVVHDAGVPLANAGALMAPVLVANQHDAATITRLLDAGVPADRQLGLITFSLPVSFIAAHEGAADALRLFLDRGLNPNATGAHGITPLMLAAAGERPGALKTLEMLMAAGADLAAQDQLGRTALDWAMTRGETEAAQRLRARGAKAQDVAPAAPRPMTTHPPAIAVAKALGRLQPAGPAFYERTKCASCHNQSLPGVAVTLASRRGIEVDRALSDHSIATIRAGWKNRREEFLMALPLGGGFVPNAIYGLFDLAEAEVPTDTITDVLVLTLGTRQEADGSWLGGNGIRPPLNASPIAATALAVRGLVTYFPPGRAAEMTERVDRARRYLAAAVPDDTQDEVFRMLGLLWSGAPRDEVERAMTRVRALQRADGGWAQWKTMTSDAYATGQALYALRAVGVDAADDGYRRGTRYLLGTQMEDGTWHVRSRAFGFQAYFETGFPHGRDQFISTAATAWATIALSYTLESSSALNTERRR
jgi:ankyrin repeat protein